MPVLTLTAARGAEAVATKLAFRVSDYYSYIYELRFYYEIRAMERCQGYVASFCDDTVDVMK